jgi:hypothetical protein
MSEHGSSGHCEACLEKEYEAFQHKCVHELMERNRKWRELYNVDSWPRWDFNHNSGELVFSENSKAKVISEVAIAGAVSNGTWEWTWGNPKMPSRDRTLLSSVREFGDEKEWTKLTTLFLTNDEYLGWELTAVAAHILEAQGVYRCPDGDCSGDFQYLVILNTRFVQ